MARWWPVLGNTVSFALASSGNMSGRGCPSLKRSSRDYSTTGDYTSCNHIWLVVWNLFFSIQLGISSFQLTFTPSFFRGFFQSPTRLDIKYLTNTMIWRWDENNFHHTAGVWRLPGWVNLSPRWEDGGMCLGLDFTVLKARKELDGMGWGFWLRSKRRSKRRKMSCFMVI
jgi:hypothetical protein